MDKSTDRTLPAAGHWTASPWVRGLTALNAALLLALGAVALGPSATAQNAGDQASRRSPGDYMMVGGQDRSQNVNLLYVIDSTNQEMVVLQWDDSRRLLNGVGYRSLKDDTERRGNR